jgi:prolyl 4-hydroxylase
VASSAAGSFARSSEISHAESCDAAGRHGEAVDWLVAGVRKNDVEALTRLGKRLLIGDRAPHLPREGAGFLVDAWGRGGAEAAAVLSVCLATGINAPPDPVAAWECLITAAVRGWQPAQQQIRVLAGNPSWADRTRALSDADHWRCMAQAVDLSKWLSVPASIDVHGNPLIRSYPLFIEPHICHWIIERAKGRLSRALVYDAGIGKTTTHVTRTNTSVSFNFLDTDFICVLLQSRMAACLGLPFRNFEAMTVLHYDVGEHISEHFDFVDPDVPNYEQHLRERGQRVVTFLVYLNDDYGSGETEFPRLGVSHKGKAGEGFFFVNAFADGRPDIRTLHAGRAPSSGEKWIVSQFVKNQPAF